MKKTIVKLLSTALCLTLFSLHVYAENADKNNIEKEARIAELADQYCEELNMNTADALSVAEKVINGENLDCVKEEYSDMAPASVIQEDGYYKAEYIYPDGSKNIISITRTNWGTPSISLYLKQFIMNFLKHFISGLFQYRFYFVFTENVYG